MGSNSYNNFPRPKRALGSMINWLDHWYRPEKELSIEEIPKIL
jgi:hypothetical protein